MEHKWGKNVRDLGLADTGCTLAARSLTDPLVVYTNEVRSPLTCRRWTLPFPDTGVPLIESGVVKPVPNSNFPYGIAVEPDSPL